MNAETISEGPLLFLQVRSMCKILSDFFLIGKPKGISYEMMIVLYAVCSIVGKRITH